MLKYYHGYCVPHVWTPLRYLAILTSWSTENNKMNWFVSILIFHSRITLCQPAIHLQPWKFEQINQDPIKTLYYFQGVDGQLWCLPF